MLPSLYNVCTYACAIIIVGDSKDLLGHAKEICSFSSDPYILLHAVWTFDIEPISSWEHGRHTYRLF